MNRRIYSTFIVLITLLTSCSTVGADIDKGILSGKPCQVPCWNGLIPGQSTSKDVDQFIQGLSDKEWASKEKTAAQITDCEEILVADQPGIEAHAFISFYIENEKLKYILSVHDQLPNLKQIVDHLGPPEYI